MQTDVLGSHIQPPTFYTQSLAFYTQLPWGLDPIASVSHPAAGLLHPAAWG